MKAHYYVYSTLASDNVYDAYRPGGGDMPVPIEGILIKGGVGVMGNNLITPRGVMTTITGEEFARLQNDHVFKLHKENGFLTVEEHSAPAEAVAANLNPADPSRQLEAGDLELDPESPIAETGPSKAGQKNQKHRK